MTKKESVIEQVIIEHNKKSKPIDSTRKSTKENKGYLTTVFLVSFTEVP